MSDTPITERQQHWLDHIEAAEAFDGSIADKAGDGRSDTGSFAVLRGETSAKSPLPNLSMQPWSLGSSTAARGNAGGQFEYVVSLMQSAGVTAPSLECQNG